MKPWQTASCITGLVFMIGSGAVTVDRLYARAEVVAQNTRSIQAIRIEVRIERVQKRVWTLEDQFGFDITKYPAKYRQEYRELQLELARLKRQLEALQ